MIEDSPQWILGIAVFGALLTIVGFITSRNLPKEQKIIRTQKFAAVAVALIFFGVSIFRPFVASYSNAKHLDELKVENINSLQDVVEFNKKQARYIEELKEDVKDLRADLYTVNRFYSHTIHLISMSVIMAVLSYAFRRREKQNDSAEIQSNQISKL